jgi:hypothetical protein
LVELSLPLQHDRRKRPPRRLGRRRVSAKRRADKASGYVLVSAGPLWQLRRITNFENRSLHAFAIG